METLPDKTPPNPTTRRLVGLVLTATVALGVVFGIWYMQSIDGAGGVQAADIRAGLDRCMAGDVRDGIARLDSLDALSPGNADVLATRGLCRSVRFAKDSVQADARAAFADLSAAIVAVQAAPAAFEAPLDRLYHQRAFVVQAMRPGDWGASLADFDRAIDFNPTAPGIVLDRGTARALSGDTAAARADLRRYEQLAPDNATEARTLRDLLRPAPPRRDSVRRDTTRASARG